MSNVYFPSVSVAVVVFRPPSLLPSLDLKIRHLSIITPITLSAPSQRLILGPANLSRLGIRVASELGRCALVECAVHAVVLLVFGLVGGLGLGFGLEGRGDGGFALETLEFGLLGGGEFWRCSAVEGGGGAGLEEEARDAQGWSEEWHFLWSC